jgi:histidinol-phosphate aminotransferase
LSSGYSEVKYIIYAISPSFGLFLSVLFIIFGSLKISISNKRNIDMSLVPPYIASLQPYKPGKPIDEVKREFGLKDVLKLASNENPLGPSPLAIEELRRTLPEVHFYPNGGYDLRKALAEHFNLKMENVIVGNGSDGIMSYIIRTFLCDDDEVLTTEAAFIGFQVLARSRGVVYRTVPYKNWHYDLPALASQVNDKTKIIYLANPNNPTGTIFTEDEFDAFYKKIPKRILIILDEAYFEYTSDFVQYPDSLNYRYDNVITLRTFSKIHGLAGLRVGYGFAHEELISNLLKVKLPFDPSTPAQSAAIGALKDDEWKQRSKEINDKGLPFTESALRSLRLDVIPSKANFHMVVMRNENEVNTVYAELLKRGVIVRPLKAFGLPHCVRITVGTQEQNEEMVQKMKEVIKIL